ncbi:uncharacterized protein LOC114932348 [Nylanderia fulva]|uniref:uncharacterized protein LOC114932348 n=1 Tax=Nylanderia fulva TaxID=613905 RepID=UPI0010FB1289|nr:uncharacterized protein LOC114932348 [Nylanderia fulva]
MSGKVFAFLCFVLLLVISSSKSQQNSTNENDNLTIRYQINTDSTTNYNDEIITLRHDLHKKIMNNIENDKEFHTNDNREDNDLIQHKRYKHSMHNKNDEQKSIKSNTNSTNVNHKRNFTAQGVYENVIEKNDSMSLEVLKNSSKDANETIIVPNEMCHNDTCIRLCCPLDDRLVHGFQYDYKIFTNGSVYLPHEILLESTLYCLVVVDGNEFEVTICSKTYDKIKEITDNKSMIYDKQIIYSSFHIVSVLLLGSVFLVYSILPELRNVHGFMLRNYSGALIVDYSLDIVNVMIRADDIPYSVCVIITFLHYFCALASFFWLIMISFDMWWTFRGFNSLRKNVRQREKRKLMYYTIFAWGCPFCLLFYVSAWIFFLRMYHGFCDRNFIYIAGSLKLVRLCCIYMGSKVCASSIAFVYLFIRH